MFVSVEKKSKYRFLRFVSLVSICLLISLFTLAQINLTYRLLRGYVLNSDASVNRGKPTLFIFEQADQLEQTFKFSSAQVKRSDVPDFAKEMVVGIAIPSTRTPPKLSVSRVFVQDSVLTIRYVRMADTSAIKNPQTVNTQPTLLLAIPKQTVLKTRLIENGKVVQIIQKKVRE
jgi:hypothetical protein